MPRVRSGRILGQSDLIFTRSTSHSNNPWSDDCFNLKSRVFHAFIYTHRYIVHHAMKIARFTTTAGLPSSLVNIIGVINFGRKHFDNIMNNCTYRCLEFSLRRAAVPGLQVKACRDGEGAQALSFDDSLDGYLHDSSSWSLMSWRQQSRTNQDHPPLHSWYPCEQR